MLRFFNARLGFALCFLFSSAVIASAEETSGTVRSVNPNRNEMTLKGILKDTTYPINKDARICLDGKKAKLVDLHEGDHVNIDLQTVGGRTTANEVRALRNAKETSGTVRSVSSQNSQLVLKGILKDTTYNLEKGGAVWINGREAKLSDLREGDHVRITYDQRGDRLMAAAVALQPK